MAEILLVEKDLDGSVFLTRRELAELWGVTIHTIDNYRKFRGLPCIKVGNIVRFELHIAQKWFKNHLSISNSSKQVQRM